MGTVVTLALPMLPGVLWLWFFYRADRYEAEPRRVVAITFVLGALATAPAALLEGLGDMVVPFLDDLRRSLATGLRAPPAALLVGCFLVIGPAEELCKFAVVRLYAYRRADFNEPPDGITYASAAALGFAALENVFYVVGSGMTIRWDVWVARSLFALPGHVIFAGWWGYALGRRKLDGRTRVLPHLGAAAALHGLYDYLALSGARWLLLLLFAVAALVLRRQIRVLRALSPFRPTGALAAVARPCPACAAPAPAAAAAPVCASCGRAMEVSGA